MVKVSTFLFFLQTSKGHSAPSPLQVLVQNTKTAFTPTERGEKHRSLNLQVSAISHPFTPPSTFVKFLHFQYQVGGGEGGGGVCAYGYWFGFCERVLSCPCSALSRWPSPQGFSFERFDQAIKPCQYARKAWKERLNRKAFVGRELRWLYLSVVTTRHSSMSLPGVYRYSPSRPAEIKVPLATDCFTCGQMEVCVHG